MNHQQAIANTMSEQELENAIIDLADAYQLHYHHDRPARTKDSWRTAIRGQKGFPDLVIVGTRTVYAELKSAKGRLSPEQQTWLTRLRNTGAEVYVWRPADWLDGTIGEVLVSLHRKKTQ